MSHFLVDFSISSPNNVTHIYKTIKCIPTASSHLKNSDTDIPNPHIFRSLAVLHDQQDEVPVIFSFRLVAQGSAIVIASLISHTSESTHPNEYKFIFARRQDRIKVFIRLSVDLGPKSNSIGFTFQGGTENCEVWVGKFHNRF